MSAITIALLLSQAPLEAPLALGEPSKFLGIIFDAVEKGHWGTAAAGLLVLLVALLRGFGKKLHDYLPDSHWAEPPLIFLYDTKPGGWALNVLTAVGAGFGTALLAAQPITLELARSVAEVSFTAAGMWGLAKDFMEWRAKPTEEVKS